MNKLHCCTKRIFAACILCVVSFGVNASDDCQFFVEGTTIPNTSGTPLVINSVTGTVISANFFNSGAIDPPFFDGGEFVSVCITPPDVNGKITAEISTDIGLDNDVIIKGYPQFLIGTKFGNISETSFRHYDNSNLTPIHQWPVVASNNNQDNEPFEFANLEYVSQVKGIGLPAFTRDLPDISITLDIDELNIVGAERDVMLESWFYDTSANSSLIGNNVANGRPIAGTINNIVGIGHPNYDELDNTLLEMMVHIGPLSRNDVSNAQRNPGQNQLTEIFSGKDFDNDGIDDHFDVDSHINVNNNREPRPGRYSSGIDTNSDGIDDADLLPVKIGDHLYSIWYGATRLAPIVIFSRETDSSMTSNFNPQSADTDLSREGEITLDWNAFLEYTMTELEVPLQNAGVSWATESPNLFSIINSQYGAIGGVELGVEPQINNPSDQPYTAVINTFDVVVDGRSLGLTDRNSPAIEITEPSGVAILPNPLFEITGTSNDDAAGVSLVSVSIERLINSVVEYWNGEAWQVSSTAIFLVAALREENWSLPGVDLSEPGEYRVVALADDRAGNQSVPNQNADIDFTVSVALCNGLPVTVDVRAGGTPTQGDDVILGSSGSDVIVALGGNDTICGEGGDDVINGGSGDDWVDAGDGNDQVFGLDGADIIFGGPGSDEIVSGSGEDLVFGNEGSDILNSGADDDVVSGGAGDDLIFGQDGDDLLNGDAGDDLILGFDGSDEVNGDAGNDILNGGSGTDTINGGDGMDTIYGLAGNDTLNGGPDDDQILGQLGDDTVTGGTGDDQLFGNAGDDVITDTAGSNVLNGGADNDILTGGSGDDQIFGDGSLEQAGNDVIDGGGGVDLLIGLAGSDTITADDGIADTVNGGPGADTCVTDAADIVFSCP